MKLSCTLLVCAAPLAYRWPEVASALRAVDFSVAVVLSDNAAAWDLPQLGENQPNPRRPDVLVICPLTFNSTAKLALGLADTFAHALASEALVTAMAVYAVPMINTDLFAHPALPGHLRTLTDSGVHLRDPQTGTSNVRALISGTGVAVADAFDADAFAGAVRESL